MPLIEELATNAPTRPSHGWAYVPDTGAPIAAVQPPGSRKRTRDANTHSYLNTTAKQEKAIQARLNELDKENHKDVSIPIPPRQGRSDKKFTPNVRRILTYQRNFGHFLADEEAGASEAALGAQRAETGTRRRVAAPPKTQTPKTQPQRQDSISTKMAPPPTPTGVKHERSISRSEPQSREHTQPLTSQLDLRSTQTSQLDVDPLLKTRDVPKMPSERVMQALLSEPPLSYNAARARWSSDEEAALKARPPRHFCGVCGYWGKVRCRRCGEFTCGLMDCWKGHEAVCTVPSY